MIVRYSIDSDFAKIAQLHASSIATGFLSTLGNSFLRELYRAIQKQPRSTVLVAESEGKVIGFIAGTRDITGLYKEVLIFNWYRFVMPLVRFALNPFIIKRIIETARYGFRRKPDHADKLIAAELMAISIEASHRGKGVGKKMIAELEHFFKEGDIKQYKVVTYSKDNRANDFYRACGFALNRQFIHHDHLMNEYSKSIGSSEKFNC